MEDKKGQIEVEELQYYFDAQERDTLDRQGRSRRSTEVLTIRDKLLALPPGDFDAVVQTIKNMLHPVGKSDRQGEDGKAKRRDASELYERTRIDSGGSSLKVGSVRGS